MKKLFLLTSVLLGGCQGTAVIDTPANPSVLEVAQFTEEGMLVRPDVTRWIHMGSSIGLAYTEGDFSADSPGNLQVVQMEPSAYDYFMTHGEYANGTMFSLSFYDVQERPHPRVNGFAEQDLVNFEIHVLDKTRYIDHRGFYLYGPDAGFANMMPAGNECVSCHNAEGGYDGTFVQFYPPIRDKVSSLAGNE